MIGWELLILLGLITHLTTISFDIQGETCKN